MDESKEIRLKFSQIHNDEIYNSFKWLFGSLKADRSAQRPTL